MTVRVQVMVIVRTRVRIRVTVRARLAIRVTRMSGLWLAGWARVKAHYAALGRVRVGSGLGRVRVRARYAA